MSGRKVTFDELEPGMMLDTGIIISVDDFIRVIPLADNAYHGQQHVIGVNAPNGYIVAHERGTDGYKKALIAGFQEMNLPLQKIHCINWGYGRLIFPWFGGWCCLSEDYSGFRFAPSKTFHNCTRTGVY